MLSDFRGAVVGAHVAGRGLNAPYGARCFLTSEMDDIMGVTDAGLNAPYGARCFLTVVTLIRRTDHLLVCLNAPYGARCFLTRMVNHASRGSLRCLNAPYGARCFLTVVSAPAGALDGQS